MDDSELKLCEQNLENERADKIFKNYLSKCVRQSWYIDDGGAEAILKGSCENINQFTSVLSCFTPNASIYTQYELTTSTSSRWRRAQ